MPKRLPPLTRVFQALADPTRLAVVERLCQGPVATSELAAPFKMAMPSFLQHLDVLADCGLIRSKKKGRVRTYELAPEALKPVEDWLSAQRKLWEKRLDRLDSFLNELKENQG